MNNIILFFSTLIVNILHMYCYKELSNYKKININIFKIVIFILFSFAIVFNSIYGDGILKALISFLCLLICYFYIFEEPLNKTISYGTITYILAIISELIFSILLVIFKISLDLFETNIFIKCGFSILVLLLTCILCRIKIFKKMGDKLGTLINKSKLIIILLIISMIVPILLDIKYINNISTYNYIINIVLSIIFEIIVSILIFYEIKSNKELQKYENLLKFLSKYEIIIDEQRAKRHEIHNNLLILKSYKNKNSKEYNELLDTLIESYSKSEDVIKNMNKLPSGIKGIVYYKLMNIDKKIIHLNVNISKQISFKIEKNNNKEYISLCKILGIILDNAIEACKESKDKVLNVDMYIKDDKVVFDITNTFSRKKTNINKINELHYSSKGKGRGYGLPIANKFLSTSKCISMKQHVEGKYFITEIFVDN